MADRIVAVLQRRILSGEIPVGTWLRHGALAEEFGVSRTPVREALRILASQNIVTIRPNSGARVDGQSGRVIREIGQVRAELEGLAAELACELISDEQLDRLTGSWREFQQRMKESREDLSEIWAQSNDAFHSVILEASGNRQLAITIGELRKRLPHNLSFAAYSGNSRLIARNLAEHEAIARAILEQDAAVARRLMVEHIRSSIDATARWVEHTVEARHR